MMSAQTMKARLERYIGRRDRLRVVDLESPRMVGNPAEPYTTGMQVVMWGDSSLQRYNSNMLLMVSQPAPLGKLPIDQLPFGAAFMVSYADLLGALTLAHATDVHTRLPLLGTHVRFPT